MRATLVADQKRVAVREVANAGRLAMRRDETAIRILRISGRDALRDDAARRVLAEVDHLGAAVDLLIAVRNGDRVELAARMVTAQNAARILPGDRGAGLDLRPGDLRMMAAAVAALGHEVIDAALALGVSRIPVLHGRIFDLGIVQSDEFDDGCVQLIFVARRRGAAFEVGDVRSLIRDDQRTLELACLLFVDAEVGGQLHRAAHAFGHVDERAVREHRRVQRRIEVVRLRHDRAQVLLHKLGMLAHRFRDRAEDDAGFRQLFLERRDDRHTVEHGIDGDAR